MAGAAAAPRLLEDPLLGAPQSPRTLKRVPSACGYTQSQGSLPRIPSSQSLKKELEEALSSKGPRHEASGSVWRLARASGRAVPFVLLLAGSFVTWLSITVQDPYLAPWALKEQHLSGSQTGVLYGVEPLTTVAVGMLAPALGRRFGHPPLLIAGLALMSLAFLAVSAAPSLVPGGGQRLWFTLLGALSMGGVGEGIVEMNANVLILELFPDASGRMLGLAEAAIGLGSICGPVVGGALFALGGFSLPSASVAVLNLLLAGACFAARRRLAQGEEGVDVEDEDDDGDGSPPAEPDVLAFANVLVGTFLAGTVSSAFEPLASVHAVRKFGWSLASVGSVFGVYGITYTTFSVLAGKWCDSSRVAPRRVFAAGAFVAALSNFLSSGTGMPEAFQPGCLICGALLLGMADALLLVPSLVILKQCAPKSLEASSSLVAVDQSVFAMGSAFGPMVMLPVGESLGFRRATQGTASLALALGLVSVPVLLWRRRAA